MIGARIKPVISRMIAPPARFLLRVGVTPDAVTVIGTLSSIVAILVLVPLGLFLPAALVVGFFVAFDMLDGAMARESGGGTRFGAALDASCDRITDGVLFAAVAWWLVGGPVGDLPGAVAPAGDGPYRSLVAAALIALVAAEVTSYVKARAEAGGLTVGGGLVERPERLVILLVGMGATGLGLSVALPVALWLLAAGGTVTVLQRLVAAARDPRGGELLDGPCGTVDPPDAPDGTAHPENLPLGGEARR